jgi:predicted secreted hydrolase
MMQRRQLVTAGALVGLHGCQPALALPAQPLVFPRDHGAHPKFRTEWWYVTGNASAADRIFGFQLTFFRTRIDATQAMQSAFAAKQLVFAHAAITDVQGKKLWHDQRVARAGFGIAQTSEADTDVRLRDWSLKRLPDNSYQASLPADDLAIELKLQPSQPILLQGKNGLSRKGPEEKQASYYYSQPHLAATGTLRVKNQRFNVTGTAWLDHEWSEEILHPQAVGWDWIGMNLLDGSALTAFRLRTQDGNTLWDGGSFRAASGQPYTFSPGDVIFRPVRSWKSPLSGATYPVEWTVRTPADHYTVRALLDNQELDSRQSTGAIYWEGLSDLIDSNGKTVGRGYLEMTGYSQRLRM